MTNANPGDDPEIDRALAQFAATGQVVHLDTAVARARVLRETGRDDVHHTGTLRLAMLLIGRGQHVLGTADFDEVVDLLRPLGKLRDPAADAVRRTALCAALSERYGRVGAVDDEAEVLALTRHVAAVVPPELAVGLANYRGAALVARYRRDRRLDDLHDAVATLTRAVGYRGAPAVHASVVNNLAVARLEQYHRTGSDDALVDALARTAEAAALLEGARSLGRGIDRVTARAGCTRAAVLALRWRLHGDDTARDEALELLDTLAATVDDRSPERGEMLMTRAGLLEDVGTAEGDAELLGDAIDLYQEALELLGPETTNFAAVANNLTVALTSFVEVADLDTDERLVYLDAAIELQRDVVDHAAVRAVRPILDHNVALLLLGRYRTVGESDDLDDAIALFASASEGIGADNLDYDLLLTSRALAHYLRYLERGGSADLDIAVELLQTAARLPGLTIGRVQSARMLADLAGAEQDWALCADASELVLTAVESVVGALDLARWDTWLRRTQGVAALGAYAAARGGDLTRAVDLAERGCGVLAAARLAQQRVTLDQARAGGHVALVDAYERAVEAVRLQLVNEPTAAGGALLASDPGHGAQRADLGAAVAGLATARAALAAVVPSLRPAASPADLLGFVLASGQSLGYLLATPAGGLRLDLCPDSGGVATAVEWLDALDDDTVLDLVVRLHAPDDEPDPRAGGSPVRAAAAGPDGAVVAGVVAELAARLTGRAVDVTPPPERVVTVGLLGLLPVAAAWTVAAGRAAPIGVAGSGLLHVTSADNARSATPRGASVAAIVNPQPCHFDGRRMPNLFGAEDEGDHLVAEFDAVTVAGPEATLGAVESLLRRDAFDVLHVAAHGWTSDDDPDLVHLLLADGPDGRATTLSAERLPAHLPFRTVFLAGCWLARSSTRLPDEAVGFPTQILQSGAAHVVAPLWPVDDEGTLLLVTVFYDVLLHEGEDAATALAAARAALHLHATGPGLDADRRAALHATADAFVLVGG